MYRTKKVITATVIGCLLILLSSMQSFALDRNVNTDVLSENVSNMADWVEQYGYRNGDGNYTINYNILQGFRRKFIKIEK